MWGKSRVGEERDVKTGKRMEEEETRGFVDMGYSVFSDQSLFDSELVGSISVHLPWFLYTNDLKGPKRPPLDFRFHKSVLRIWIRLMGPSE